MPKTVLITGCSSGFGLLATHTFHEKGWNVVTTMLDPETETDLETTDTMLVSRLDVTDVVTIRDTVNKAIEKFGSLDVLVNNAAIGSNAVFEQSPDRSTRALYEVNVFGVMNVMREVLPHFRKQGHGRVLNVTSLSGLFGLPGNSIYSSTKFAVEGLTETLALEYRALGIQFKTIAPGTFTSTPFDAKVECFVDTGDDQIRAHSKKIREFFVGLALGGKPQTAQKVADKIYECATEDTPVHNPVGADANMIMKKIDEAENRQAFLDWMDKRLLPPDLL